ncbi:MAG: LuxR C-terminal-related transcriptional regulator [Porticoccaceae bacterium]|nr:LuxR C-terminal-related transcriptional regulator [Porticoccaceae bacterium]
MHNAEDVVTVLKLMNVPSALQEKLQLPNFQISSQVSLMVLRLNFDALRFKTSAQGSNARSRQLREVNLIFDDQAGSLKDGPSAADQADLIVKHVGTPHFSSFEAFSTLIADLSYAELQLSGDFWLPVQSVLSYREIEVLHHVYNGLSSKQVADELSLSARTVELHRQNCSKKIGTISPRTLSKLFSSTTIEAFMWRAANPPKDSANIDTALAS